VEFEDLHIIFYLIVPEVELLNQLQRVLNRTELLGVHFDRVVHVLHDQQILLDYNLADHSELLDLCVLQAALNVQFGIQRVPSLPRLLIDDYGLFIDLHIDVSIEIKESSIYRVLAGVEQGVDHEEFLRRGSSRKI